MKQLIIITLLSFISTLAIAEEASLQKKYAVKCDVYGQTPSPEFKIIKLLNIDEVFSDAKMPKINTNSDSCVPISHSIKLVGTKSLKLNVIAYKCMTNDIYFAQDLTIGDTTASSQIGEAALGGENRLKLKKKDGISLPGVDSLSYVNSDCSIELIK